MVPRWCGASGECSSLVAVWAMESGFGTAKQGLRGECWVLDGAAGA
jgi:hypothetical protein